MKVLKRTNMRHVDIVAILTMVRDFAIIIGPIVRRVIHVVILSHRLFSVIQKNVG